MAVGLGKSLKHCFCCALVLWRFFFFIRPGMPKENLSMAVPPLLLEDAMDISIGLTTGFPNRSTPFLPNVEVGGRRLMLGFCTVLFCTRGEGGIVEDEAGCFFGGGLLRRGGGGTCRLQYKSLLAVVLVLHCCDFAAVCSQPSNYNSRNVIKTVIICVPVTSYLEFCQCVYV